MLKVTVFPRHLFFRIFGTIKKQLFEKNGHNGRYIKKNPATNYIRESETIQQHVAGIPSDFDNFWWVESIF